MSQILAEMDSGDTIHSPAESQPPQDFNVTEGARRRSDALKAGAASLWEKGWGSLVPSLGSSLSMQRWENWPSVHGKYTLTSATPITA